MTSLNLYSVLEDCLVRLHQNYKLFDLQVIIPGRHCMKLVFTNYDIAKKYDIRILSYKINTKRLLS